MFLSNAKIVLGLSLVVNVVHAKYYSMYVWTRAFDEEATECNGVFPASKNAFGGACFNHAWETPEARAHLWASCKVPGREVTRIFLSDVKKRTQNNGKNGDGVCDPNLMTTLEEARARGIEVYGLFADSDAAFSERNKATYLAQFNTECGTAAASFDGVSVNNEHFSSIKSCNPDNDYELDQLAVLDALNETAFNAGPLPLHFSVSWNWDCCSCSSSSYDQRLLTWNGEEKSALEHMIDITDSVDVQVAWNTGSTMQRRSLRPYQYWAANKMGSTSSTAFYVLAYTNPNSDCRQSFAPHRKGSDVAIDDTCSTGDRTEAGMYNALDEVVDTETYARGGIHYHGGVYSSGMPGWPKHE
eukprot:CAMPEP_0119008316 /NCGR_PEP_ID=MMETSP1176-20130426/3602_1 /TAXON_ID=265551 /ORGANISM="Synedropsis recta cf, Strain CCMP1620" /LENGTH=356 /DNA_ID=CAMNT_0006960625 /DNA_START=100 /DNA_END=1170 /DNA_ORIENTATION=-